MGSTPRQHRYQVPMATRSTDASVLEQCAGRWVLTLIHEDEQKPASFFQLGTSLHDTIEGVCLNDWDYGTALAEMTIMIDVWIDSIEGKEVLETSKRGVDTIHDDAERMLKNWFKYVHPDGDSRHEIYNKYLWPPVVERKYTREGDHEYPAWGSIDAIFTHINNAEVALVDWKSGTQKQKTDFQLHYYEYGITPLLHGNVGKAWFHHLDRVRKHAMVQMAGPYPGDEAMVQIINDTEEIKEAIVAGDSPDFNPDWYCNFCPVQEFCPEDGDVRNRDSNRASLEDAMHLLRRLDKPLEGGKE